MEQLVNDKHVVKPKLWLMMAQPKKNKKKKTPVCWADKGARKFGRSIIKNVKIALSSYISFLQIALRKKTVETL